MAQEMFAFTNGMQHLLKRKLSRVLSWVLNNVLSVVVGGAVGIFPLWLAPNSTIVVGLAVIVFLITALGTLWSLIAFPIPYPAIRRAAQKLAGIFCAMADAYSAIGGKPASTKHIEERVARGTDAGVVWLVPT